MVSVLLCAVLYCGEIVLLDDRNRKYKLMKNTFDLSVNSVEVILEERTKAELQTVLGLETYPFHNIYSAL